MDYISEVNVVNIKHKINTGNKICIWPFFPDSIDFENNTVYLFNGRLQHNCELASCHINKQDRGKWLGDKKYLLIRTTRNVKQFYRDEGYNLVTGWECPYDVNIAALTKKYESDYLPTYFNKNRGMLKQGKIRRDISNGKLYGFCQVSNVLD